MLSSTSIHEVHTLLKTAFSYAVEWDLIHKIPLPRDAPKVNIEERTIWDEKTMLAALQTIENPALHLAVHMSMILSLREGEILGLQPSDLDFDAADGRGTISVSKTMQRANKDALEKLDPNQVYHTFPDRREGSKSSLILKKPKTKKSNRVLYMTKPLKEELLAWLEKLKQDAAEINSRKEQLAAEMKEIKATQTELEAKKAKVNKLREQRAYMLYKAQEEEQSSQEEYERLLAISENIASMLRNMENAGGGAPAGQGGTGQFMWPCNGPITSYYGWRTHPIFGTTKYHSGMDIAVDSGTPIHAADSGTIVYSGWLGGYGNCVMIDHGGGLVTLYAHNSALNVGEGQYVSKGAVVAYAGSTGYSTGPHCHFEVRLHGELTEPLNYLP